MHPAISRLNRSLAPRCRLVASLALSVWLFVSLGFAQSIAFPGALGFGSYASGGRNGTVYHVITLADSGPGSFRTGVSSGNRTIVFDVGGEIKLLTAVSCSSSLTIAGQTAPGGIVFNGGEISFANRNNIICRYLRIRPGSDTSSTLDDALSFYRASNLIMDHSSLAFAPWNDIDGVGDSTHVVTAITLQNCIIANPTGQQFGAHTESVGGQWSWFYNIFANSHNRNPLAKVNTVFINNVEYNNSAGYTTHTSTPFKHDIVNNCFIAGPASGGNFPWYQMDKNQSIYCAGNQYDSNKNGALDGSTTTPYWYQGVGTVLTSPWSSWTTIVPTMTADLAYRYDVSTAGTLSRDEVDALIISQVQTLGSGTTGTGSSTTGPDGGLYTSQAQTGLGNNGYGTVTGLTAPTDTDGDGMPDYWELATGSNPNVANPLTNTLTGYTLLENYLNYLAAPHAVTQTNTPVDINLRQFTSGFSAGATFALANATNGTVGLLNSTNAHFVPTANFAGLGAFNFTVTDGGLSLGVTVTLCITPVTPPASATQFGGAIIGVSLAAAPLPSNLIWRGDGTANTWNTTVSNWFNGSGLAAFKNNDVVSFDDTGSNIPNLSLAGALTPRALLFEVDNNYTLAGTGSIGGTGSLSKNGTGELLINTTNSSFSGPIVLNSGSLVLGSGANVGTGKITLNHGTILGLSANNTINPANPVSVPAGETGTITNVGIGNSFSGAFTSGDSTGTLNLLSSMSFAGSDTNQFNGFTGTINIAPGSTLRFASASNTIGSLNPKWVVNGTLQPRNAGNTILLGSISGSGQLAGPQTGNTGPGNTAFTIGGNNDNSIFTGNIVSNANSAGSFVCVNKLGAGTLTLSGNNSYGGTNAVLAGALFLNGTNTPSLCTVFSGALLGGTGVITGPVSIMSGGILSPGADNGSAGTITLGSHLATATPTLYFTLSGSPSGANDRINMAGTLAMSGVQTFVFNLTENALGTGTYGLIEGATNSTMSGVSLAGNLPGNTRQTIVLTNAAPGSNPSFVRLVVSGVAASLVWRGTNGVNWDTSTINWANGSTSDRYYNLDAVLFDDSGANPSGVTLATTLWPAAVVVNSSHDYTLGGTGALVGTGALTKSGTGTLTIGTSNSAYAGAINLFGGTLAASPGSALGSGTLTISNGATLTLPSSEPSVFFGGPVIIPANQTGTISSGALGNGLSGNFFSGNSASTLNLVNGVSFGGTNSAQFDNFTGTINIQSGGALRYSANSSGNTYGSLAPTLIINGTLQPRNAGNTLVLGRFSGSGALAGAQSPGSTGDTLYVIGGNNADATFSGVISSNTAVAGSDVIVNKIGTGTLTLSGASTFAGGTTVSAGTLRVTNPGGSATGTGDLEIFSGATLTGSSHIASNTTVDNGATLAPGNPTGALTFTGNVTLNDNSILIFALGTNSDSVIVGGDLLLTGQLSLTNAGGFGVGAYPLFTCGGTLTFGNLTLAAAPAGFNYSFNTNTPGVVQFIVAPTQPPAIGAMYLSGTNLVCRGTSGIPLGRYYVLGATNLTLPKANWSRLMTNAFDAAGGFTFTCPAAMNPSCDFFQVQLP